MPKKSNKQKQIIRNNKYKKKKAKQKNKSKQISADSFDFQQFMTITKDNSDKPIEKIFKDKLNAYSKLDTASVFSSLSLNPNYQSSQLRIEKAISISLSFCEGNQKPDLDLIKFILEKSYELFGHLEDAAEDVFISTVWFEDEQYKLATGLWEGGIYQAQLFLNFMNQAPNDKKHLPIKKALEAILTTSNIVIENKKLEVNNIGAPYPIDDFNYDELTNLQDLIDSVELRSFEQSKFLPSIDIDNLGGIYKQELGESDLEETPFFVNGNTCRLILPSSISTCIKRLVINFVRKNYSNEFLNSLFLKSQAKRLHETNLFRAFSNIPIKFYKLKNIDDFGYYETLLEFDEGYFFHFIFLGETFNSLGSDWFNGFAVENHELSKHIENSITKAKTFVIDKQRKRKGCTIIVPCGYGRGLSLSLDVKTNNQWMVEIINSHDLDTISKDIDCNPRKVWRIIESFQQLKTMGVHIQNINGFLNLYSYAKENDYSLVSHESFQEPNANPALITIILPFNSQSQLRSETLKNTEERSINHPILGDRRVVRGFANSLFSNNDRYEIFVPTDSKKEKFECVYIDFQKEFWIEQTVFPDIDIALQIQLFEASLSWIKKIINVIEQDGLSFPKNLKIWNIKFEFPENLEKIRKLPEPHEILFCFSNEFKESILHSQFGVEFIDGLRSERNYSEQALILSLVTYLCEVNQFSNSEYILNKIIESHDAKHIHIFVANEYQEFFISEKEEPIFIERADENNIKLNLGWINRDRSLGNLIEGKNDCKQYLNSLVGNAWEIIQEKLNSFDRESLILKLLMNIEFSEHQKKRWERSFRANLVLQKDQDDLHNVVDDKIAQLNAASLSSRLVIEMAICECPQNNGIKSGVLDIQELMCLASLMHHMGGVSEAINYEAIEPKLVISTFGDVMFNHDFHDTVVMSYYRNMNRSSLSNKVKEYTKHLTEPTIVEKVNDLLEKDFNDAWLDEFGFTFDDARHFFDKLEAYGLEKNELIYKISYSQLVDLFQVDTKDITKRIIKELVIYPRKSWTDIPAPFKKTDWQPWKFRRRFSLVMRPIVQLDETNFLISPQHVRNAFSYLIKSCHRATLDENHFSSPIMRKWIGETRGRNGLAFNTTVANRLKELGWEVREEIKLTEILNKKLEDYGDVDVLAWNSKLNIVAIIECKDLDFAKTQGEIARQLYDFKGQETHNGRKDRLLKHMHRLDVLNTNKDGLSNFINAVSEIIMKGFVVFSNTVPMEFNENRLYKDKIEFLTFEQLEKLADYK